jgi:hypothetical protein
MGPTQPPIQRVRGFVPGSKAARAWNWPPTKRCPQSFSLAKGGWPRGYVQFMFDYKNYIIKIMSKSPSWRLRRLHGRLKPTGTEKNLHILKLLCFSVFHWTSHQATLVAYLGRSVNHVEPVTSSCLQNFCSLIFALGECCSPAVPLLACANTLTYT